VYHGGGGGGGGGGCNEMEIMMEYSLVWWGNHCVVKKIEEGDGEERE